MNNFKADSRFQIPGPTDLLRLEDCVESGGEGEDYMRLRVIDSTRVLVFAASPTKPRQDWR